MRSRLFCSVACGVVFIATMTHGAEYESVTIRVGAEADSVELKVAELLQQRIAEPSGLPTRVERTAGDGPTNSLLILLGIPAHHSELQKQLEDDQIPALTQRDPGPEGFLVKMLADNDVLLAAGVDQRGVLYAAGEILRQLDIKEKSVEIPDTLDVRTAPAFAIRGTQYGQSGVAKKLAKVRDWTPAETQRVILDYALAGANTFSTGPGPMFDFIKSFGLMTQGGFGANTGPGPPEWNAKESIGRIGYLCLSVPEARTAQLKRCEDQFRSSPTYDFVKFHGGDGGGCECDLCDPYGLKFIKLVEKMAAIIHKYHPTTKIYFTNQKFDNADDNAIFEYLQEQPRDWLWGWGYGPGSDATSWQPGHRQTHRMDLFRYPGFGPYGLYPREILRQLPPRHQLVYYNEITHWRYAQHAYIQMYPRADRDGELPPRTSGHEIYERRPDQGLTMVYDRLTFYAWPRFYHRVFNDLMRYGVGDITHSSGHHDHFNQWMWQRLLWAPRTSVEDVVDEYCQTWFGREAAPLMAEAIFQLEENLEEAPATPLIEKEGIDRNFILVSQAKDEIPEIHLRNNWLWRLFMQKAALDKYTQLAVRQQTELQTGIENSISKALAGGDVAAAIDHSLANLDALAESAEMALLREEAGKLGEESNALFGVRNEGYFNLKHDFIGLGWLRRQLEQAKQANGTDQVELLKMIVDYENPGPGGFYDNLGTNNRAPHVVKGYPYDHGQPYVSMMLSEGNRPSQRSMHFTQDESKGVTLKYHDLDPNARYRVRFTFVRPWYQSRYAERMNQKSQTILADDLVLAEDQPLPERMSEFFTFDIPQTATRDGELTIQLRKAKDVANGPRVEREQWRNSGGWGTLVSEVWLMKQDD
ncbi:hypothetical protein Mal52_32470 [Symmachiella dynata]|uniref:Alpha glucuronidase N-terminal domain-containing protein n=1 Tax=Symmachiella dynata TaxID=2527995 RepID=A0A517ZQJ2_9PLAN|nr:hypothetical protein [Symmachiella dynata]QDU44761.1 hypothetical protein Mal52_32470 [Symmachiella dynata]